MTTRQDRLARDFVDAALELHRRRLWTEVPGDAVFLVRVPTEDLPLAANVMGQAGVEFGLGLARGEGAFRRMAGLYSEQAATEEFTDAGDLLSVTFEPWGALPDEFRRLVRAAGLQPRRERVVPMALTKRPYELARPAGRGELRTLLWVVRGVLAAWDAGELRPASLPPVDRRRRRVLELEIGGTPRKPAVTARLVPWPEGSEALDLPPLVALPADLQDLPRLGGRWLVARLPMAAEIRGDARAVFGVFVAEERGGLVLNHGLAMGDELAPVVETLSQAFRGEGFGERCGLPREIVFDSPRLHRAFTPVLAGLGIESVLDEECPALLDLSAALESTATALSAEELGAPETFQEWKAVDQRVASWLVEETLDKNRATTRAMTRYFGIAAEGEEVLERLEHYSPFGAFVEWLAADYRATKRSKTMVEKLLANKSLDPAERVLLEARRRAVLSIFRVDSSEPGATIEIEDVLSGERFTVHDKSMSGCELEGVFLPLRLLRVDEWIFPVIAGPPLAALHVDGALEALERIGAELTPEGLRRDAHLVGRLWSRLLAREERAPVLQNTDGEPLELQTATFRVADPATLEGALAERDDLDFDAQEGGWVWLREGAPGGLGDHTVLGRLDILDDRLVLEVNSTSRLERARGWLEAVPGVRFERSTARGLDRSERPLDDRLPGPPPEPPAAETAELLERVAHEQYRRWLDERVPLLGDLTPRQACATEEGRRSVARLVRTMPAIGTPNGPIEVPREELLRELGISSAE